MRGRGVGSSPGNVFHEIIFSLCMTLRQFDDDPNALVPPAIFTRQVAAQILGVPI